MHSTLNSKKIPILHGVHIGEHSFIKSEIKEEIKRECVDKGYNFAVIRVRELGIEPEYFTEWATYCADHGVYFMFLYSIFRPKDRKLFTVLDADTVARIKSVAGEYFLGDCLGELGTNYSFKGLQYYDYPSHCALPNQNIKDMQEGKDRYIQFAKEFTDMDRKLGITDIACVESVTFSHYNMEAGVTLPISEVMVGSPDVHIAAARGAARANGASAWGTYFAQEWYGGKYHEDILKQKRLALAYKYAYLAGSDMFCLESGNGGIESYGERYPAEHSLCAQYREVLDGFAKLLKEDKRPQGPIVKVAFVYGNLDGWCGLPAGSVWGQHKDAKWGGGDAEHSWRILDDIEHASPWHNTANFGDVDLSGKLPYGQYDIIPATASLDVFSRYEYVIFTGWNTMTPEIYETLTHYVEGGGTLLMTAAHLNTSAEREGEYLPIQEGDLAHLFGCRLHGEFSSMQGYKFARNGLLDGIRYPGAVDPHAHYCDPWYEYGYVKYAVADVTDGTVTAFLSDSFIPEYDEGKRRPAIVEKRHGNGVAILMTTREYPGMHAIYPPYQLMVRLLMNHAHAASDIRVCGSDKVKMAVYEGGTVYLLNTDFDCDVVAHIFYNGTSERITLAPGELRRMNIQLK